MFSWHMQHFHPTTICSSLALCFTFLAIAALDIGGAVASESNSNGDSDDGKLMVR